MIRLVTFDGIVKRILPRLEEVPLLLVLNIQDYVEEFVPFGFLLVLGVEQVVEGQEVLRLSLKRLLDFRLHRLDQVIWVWSCPSYSTGVDGAAEGALRLECPLLLP